MIDRKAPRNNILQLATNWLDQLGRQGDEAGVAARGGDLWGEQPLHVPHGEDALFAELGVSWTVHKLTKDPWGKNVERAFAGMVMTLHLGGQLVPLLSQAGALWL
uniref:Uncharacterized protein n=1 Tax=Aegilops tauschii TaxID=37682 RepID=M8BZP5_AEGTA